jgi:hypothetical protein
MFILPLIPLFANAAITVGEAIGLGISAIGIGACVKGSVDFHKAKSVRTDVKNRYEDVVARTRDKAKRIEERLAVFGKKKLEAYGGIIQDAAKAISRFLKIDLTSFKDLKIDNIRFLKDGPESLKERCVRASDVLSALAAGISAAVFDRFPYKETPPLIPGTGKGLPAIPYSAIALSGISWGISGGAAKSRSMQSAAEADIEIEKLTALASGFEAVMAQIDEGERIIASLSEKLKRAVSELDKIEIKNESALSQTELVKIDTALSLTKALKEVIETPVTSIDGTLSEYSGLVFEKVKQEYVNVV